MERILLVEDDADMATMIAEYLGLEGFGVDRLHDGAAAAAAEPADYDLVLLDVMLPNRSGFDVLRSLRRSSDVPVIMLTARDNETDCVVGLELGADDYITKPYSFRELLARIRAITRRTSGQVAARILKAGSLEIDVRARRVTVEGQEIALTPKEFDLVALLARHAGEIVTRQQILAEVWQTTWLGSTRTIDVHIVALRRKLDDPDWIETIRGSGFRLCPKD
jgi:DNA-binding response OmpR family regulator